ncbi:restriction endonuclease subunit S [Vagococcus fluvialis]|uniref:restriction endonuclease subunit S n=1 Tax=Vagococcus fluvialis TaxID=2738 RepID=UPI003B58CD1E
MAKIDDSVKKKVPELRFKGFTDDWEERKFADFIDVKSGKDYKHLNSGPIPVYGTGGYMLSVDRALSDIDAIGIGRKGTIDKPYLLKAPFWTVDTLFYAVPKQNIDLQFSLSIFKKINWKKFDESTGVPSLSKTVINSVGASVPCYEEQQKIGSFFKQLDKTIALHQRKLDLLKEQKKGYLQKMFPKNGAKVPELRFAGFADDWEERKFENNIVSIQTGTNLLGTDANEGTPLLKMGNIQRGYFSFNKLEYLDSNSNVESENIVNYGDFLFNTRNTLELVGKGATWTGMSGKYAFNSNIARFKFNGIDTIFFNYLYNTQQVISQVHARAVGTTSVAAVYPRDLNSLLYYLPSIEEQKKIGSFFNQLDNTIALHQRKLDLLKEQKKGFLQKMFV